MTYKRPPQSIEGDIPDSVKEHMVHNHALASIIYENNIQEPEFCFTHDTETDAKTLAQAKKKLSEKLHLVDIFADFTELGGIEFEADDFVNAERVREHLEQNTTNDREKQMLKDFIFSERGGGGLAKCASVSYVQGNMAYHHIHHSEL